ncbi:class 1 isoprenoid biosynthesis enzyme [Nonomuraea rhodomycinica]|uniref:Class 1 isoprenoid biosynthesis enzyme n=1 Tax=Nonomuraea rhodomycinica TaxID=1712872 RepID=A0A7Y6MCJ7_9ACTN|nr:class 1 isoprenoid biosynthesis enzyme [Nonomuraea rhodomycinica]NUW42872.1 class 1 isoprenoid biosynthesis enzyme [Nonomuraea rhodomycinica]
MIRDLLTVARCARPAIALPVALKDAVACAPAAVRDFERAVEPIVRDVLAGPEREAMIASLRGTALTFNIGIRAYARMAGRPCDGELAMLAGSVARLYDDLIDNGEDPEIDSWVASLFGAGEPAPGGRPVPSDRHRRLLAALYAEIRRRAPGELWHTALLELHDYQVLSRRQRDPATPAAQLGKITRGKGGLACVVLFGLVHPDMSVVQRDTVMEAGEALQLLDDYLDQDADLRDGIGTPLNRGEVSLAEVGARLRALRPRLAASYGRAAARPFVATLLLVLAADVLKRHRSRRARTRQDSPLGLLLAGGTHAIPPKRAS